MTQAGPTLCAHNAPGQVVRSDVAVPCRQCGAMIKASPRTVDASRGAVAGDGTGVNAAYPGDGNATNQNWVFGR